MRIDTEGLHLRQSEINDWLLCPERFRRTIQEQHAAELLGLVPRKLESDAALVGTAVHHGIETEIGSNPRTLEELNGMVADYYTVIAEGFTNDPTVEFSTHTFGTLDRALVSIEHLLTMWHGSDIRYELLYDIDEQPLIEWEFDVPFMKVGALDIYLTGTADLVIPNDRIIDWKTAGQKYQRWEKQRWAVQPTVYTYAAARSGYFENVDKVPFDFWVFQRGAATLKPQHVSCWRDAGHWEWLKDQIRPMVMNVLQEAPTLWEEPWQKNDQSALCSSKWCPWWNTCKGKHMSEGWEQ
jgi:hypothetical protein